MVVDSDVELFVAPETEASVAVLLVPVSVPVEPLIVLPVEMADVVALGEGFAVELLEAEALGLGFT